MLFVQSGALPSLNIQTVGFKRHLSKKRGFYLQESPMFLIIKKRKKNSPLKHRFRSLFFFKFIFKIIFYFLSFCPAYMPVHDMCAWDLVPAKSRDLELVLWHCVWAEKEEEQAKLLATELSPSQLWNESFRICSKVVVFLGSWTAGIHFCCFLAWNNSGGHRPKKAFPFKV